MKGGLCIIYASLLTISIISSGALFILVVSDVLQTDPEVNTTLDGLQNVSKKYSPLPEKADTKNLSAGTRKYDGDNVSQEALLQDNEMTFTETLSLNTVTTDGLPDTGQPPILISLADSANFDLKNADGLLFVNDSEQHNDTKTYVFTENKHDLATEEKEMVAPDKTISKPSKEPTLIVKAKPKQQLQQTDDTISTTTSAPTTTISILENDESQTTEAVKQNESRSENVPLKSETSQEDIPSFSEWAQKQLAEAEKKDIVLNHSSQPSHSNTNINNKSTKLRSKNYASPACGAKIVAVNPEAGSASSILSPNRDEYMLNTCNSRIWFVVELCEAVQAQKIEIANYELFSSTPKEFAVYFSDRFPTRDWASVGQFTAADIREAQSFDLFPHMFGKFIKVEMLSHYGSEHYCPISLFKVFGTSEFEVLEKENAQHISHVEDDDEIIDVPDIPTAEAEASKNLFGSARDAVMSIMKKAAQVLVKTEVPQNMSCRYNDTSSNDTYKICCSPSHIIVCDNCSQAMYNELHYLISCSADKLTILINQLFIRETLKCTGICQPFGLDFKSTKTIAFSNDRVSYMKALFSQKYLAALCNILAIQEKKVVLNTSFETEQNVTTNITDSLFNISSERTAEQSIVLPNKNDTNNIGNKTAKPTELENKNVLEEKTNDSITKVDNKLPNENKEKIDVPILSEEPLADVSGKQVQDQDPPNTLNTTTKETPEVRNEDTVKSEAESKEPSKIEIKNTKQETAEKAQKESGSTHEDITEQILIDNDSFLSDLDQLTADPTPPGMASTPNNPQAQTMQKESVFLRLSNRVKTLERNMSLSGQYLEELSRRYKKQVEEMQKSFEKTVLQMTEERRKSNEREQKYLEQMSTLQEQLAQMAVAMKILMQDRDSWFGNITFFKFIVLQSLIAFAVFYYITKRKRPVAVVVPVGKKSAKNKRNQDKVRRKSVEGVSGHKTPSAKKRRPSEEALQIARQSTEEVDAADDDDDGEWQLARKNRKRKTSILHRSNESPTRKINWQRQDSIGVLRENPIPLDEEEFLAPVSEPTTFDSKEQNKIVKKELPKSNGSFFTNLKSKTMKTRRLSSPAFLRTLSRQSSRSNPSPVVRKIEPMFNGALSEKETSVSPTGSSWSNSTQASRMNGQFDSDSVSGKQSKRKSFKNIFRKVF